MSDAVLVALITGGIGLIGTGITIWSSDRILAYKLEELQKDFNDLKAKVEKHNNLVERMTAVEESTKSAHKRIDELRGH